MSFDFAETYRRWVNGQDVSTDVVELCRALGKPLQSHCLIDALADALEWLEQRQRWSAIELAAKEQEQVQERLRRLRLIGYRVDVAPVYDYAIIFGDVLTAMQHKLAIFKTLIVEVKELILVTTLRPANAVEVALVNAEGGDSHVATEADLARFALQRLDWQSTQVAGRRVVVTPDACPGQAADLDTVNQQLLQQITPRSSLLFVAEDPYALRQSFAVRRHFAAVASTCRLDFAFGPARKSVQRQPTVILDQVVAMFSELLHYRQQPAP